MATMTLSEGSMCTAIFGMVAAGATVLYDDAGGDRERHRAEPTTEHPAVHASSPKRWATVDVID